LINRVAWDNALRVPDANELGWKETFRVNPLQDTIIALRPVAPTQPFDVPNSERLIDPTMSEGAELKGAPLGFQDTNANPVTILNHRVNYGWEYMVHCHLLSHEEMDMMHGVAFAVPPKAPSNLAAAIVGNSVILTWNDNSASETGFTIQRSTDGSFPVGLTDSFPVGPNTVTYIDTSIEVGKMYYYRIVANNVVGDTLTYPAPSTGFPSTSADSAYSNTATPILTMIIAPTNLQATTATNPLGIILSWIDSSYNENEFAIWRSINGGIPAQIATVPSPSPAGTGNQVTYTDTNILVGNTYAYYVTAINAAISSRPSNTVTVAASAPLAPSNLAAARAPITGNQKQDSITLTWTDNANNEDNFQIQVAFTMKFDSGTSTYTVPANTVTFTQIVDKRRNCYCRVRATNAFGNSEWSNEVLVRRL
jgi:fibronectin type 3 domain-containing protein